EEQPELNTQSIVGGLMGGFRDLDLGRERPGGGVLRLMLLRDLEEKRQSRRVPATNGSCLKMELGSYHYIRRRIPQLCLFLVRSQIPIFHNWSLMTYSTQIHDRWLPAPWLSRNTQL